MPENSHRPFSSRIQHDLLKEQIHPSLAFQKAGLPLGEWKRLPAQRFKKALGLFEPEVELEPECTWYRDEPDGQIERWEIRAEAGAWISIYLAISRETTGLLLRRSWLPSVSRNEGFLSLPWCESGIRKSELLI